jgi:hypothetical protein
VRANDWLLYKNQTTNWSKFAQEQIGQGTSKIVFCGTDFVFLIFPYFPTIFLFQTDL